MAKGYREPISLRSVAEFHNEFDIPVLQEATIPVDRAQLRIDLLQEELEELKEAVKNNDIIEVADAFADLQYVLSGAILEFGMQKNFKAMFDEVHRSNMSKTCGTQEIAGKTQRHYLSTRGVDSYVEGTPEGRFIVKRKTDSKVLKSIDYSPADLKQFF